jgi:hypothetical protein
MCHNEREPKNERRCMKKQFQKEVHNRQDRAIKDDYPESHREITEKQRSKINDRAKAERKEDGSFYVENVLTDYFGGYVTHGFQVRCPDCRRWLWVKANGTSRDLPEYAKEVVRRLALREHHRTDPEHTSGAE